MVVILIYNCKKAYSSIAAHEHAFTKCNIPCWNGIAAHTPNIWSIEMFGPNRKILAHTINRESELERGPSIDIFLPYLVDMFRLRLDLQVKIQIYVTHFYLLLNSVYEN